MSGFGTQGSTYWEIVGNANIYWGEQCLWKKKRSSRIEQGKPLDTEADLTKFHHPRRELWSKCKWLIQCWVEMTRVLCDHLVQLLAGGHPEKSISLEPLLYLAGFTLKIVWPWLKRWAEDWDSISPSSLQIGSKSFPEDGSEHCISISFIPALPFSSPSSFPNSPITYPSTGLP